MSTPPAPAIAGSKATRPTGIKRRQREQIAVPRLGMDSKEFAAALGIGQSTFFKYKSAGQIGPQPGPLGLYSADEIRAWCVAGMPPEEKWAKLKSRVMQLDRRSA